MTCFSKIMVVVMALMLSACATKQPLTVTVTEYRNVTLPDALFEAVPIQPPPDKKLYLSSRCEAREQLLSNYMLVLMGDLEIYEKRLETMHRLQKEQLQLLEKKP